MNWLNNMLWGGSALLAFEHVWHGSVVALGLIIWMIVVLIKDPKGKVKETLSNM